MFWPITKRLELFFPMIAMSGTKIFFNFIRVSCSHPNQWFAFPTKILRNFFSRIMLPDYKAAVVKCRDLITGFEVRKEREIIDSKNNGSFYRHVNKRLSNGRGIGTHIDASGSPVTNDKEKANLFNNYYGSVCTTDNGDIPTVNKIVPDNVALYDIDFNRNDVLRTLKKIKPNESSGPDNLPLSF